MMKKKSIWPWAVFGILALSLTAISCAGVTRFVREGGSVGVANIPPIDADADGNVDPGYLAWVSQNFGGVPWLPTVLGLGGLLLAGYARWQDAKNHGVSTENIKANKEEIKEAKVEIAMTDKNVETIAEAAKVPDKALV